MESLLNQLENLQGLVCLMCIGNTDGGDDALGMRLGQALSEQGLDNVAMVGAEPEAFLSSRESHGYDHFIFIDAVDFGAEPGSVVFLNSQEMISRFPQVSTHRLSLGLIAQLLQANRSVQAWLLGVQPESLQRGADLSPSVQATMMMLNELLMCRFGQGVSVC